MFEININTAFMRLFNYTQLAYGILLSDDHIKTLKTQFQAERVANIVHYDLTPLILNVLKKSCHRSLIDRQTELFELFYFNNSTFLILTRDSHINTEDNRLTL